MLRVSSIRRSSHVSAHDLNQFFRRVRPIHRLHTRGCNMLTHMALDHLGEQRAQRAATSGDRLQDATALLSFFQRALYGANLAGEAADAVQQLPS